MRVRHAQPGADEYAVIAAKVEREYTTFETKARYGRAPPLPRICTRTELTPATSALGLGLGSPQPQLHRDWTASIRHSEQSRGTTEHTPFANATSRNDAHICDDPIHRRALPMRAAEDNRQ